MPPAPRHAAGIWLYRGQCGGADLKHYRIDIGFTKESQLLGLVFAPCSIAAGALTGRRGLGANVLVDGGRCQNTLQPVSLETASV